MEQQNTQFSFPSAGQTRTLIHNDGSDLFFIGIAAEPSKNKERDLYYQPGDMDKLCDTFAEYRHRNGAGVGIIYEHETPYRIGGTALALFRTKENKLGTIGHISGKTVEGRELINGIQTGRRSGLSLGSEALVSPDYERVLQYGLLHIGVTDNPLHKSAWIQCCSHDFNALMAYYAKEWMPANVAYAPKRDQEIVASWWGQQKWVDDSNPSILFLSGPKQQRLPASKSASSIFRRTHHSISGCTIVMASPGTSVFPPTATTSQPTPLATAPAAVSPQPPPATTTPTAPVADPNNKPGTPVPGATAASSGPAEVPNDLGNRANPAVKRTHQEATSGNLQDLNENLKLLSAATNMDPRLLAVTYSLAQETVASAKRTKANDGSAISDPNATAVTSDSDDMDVDDPAALTIKVKQLLANGRAYEELKRKLEQEKKLAEEARLKAEAEAELAKQKQEAEQRRTALEAVYKQYDGYYNAEQKDFFERVLKNPGGVTPADLTNGVMFSTTASAAMDAHRARLQQEAQNERLLALRDAHRAARNITSISNELVKPPIWATAPTAPPASAATAPMPSSSRPAAASSTTNPPAAAPPVSFTSTASAGDEIAAQLARTDNFALCFARAMSDPTKAEQSYNAAADLYRQIAGGFDFNRASADPVVNQRIKRSEAEVRALYGQRVQVNSDWDKAPLMVGSHW